MSAEIALRGLRGAGLCAIVDDEDAEELGQFVWWLHIQGYAYRGGGKDACVLMHRQLLGLAAGDPRNADHINHDKLDNRRANLRLATAAENGQNRRGAVAGSLSTHRGVYYDGRGGGAWYGQVKVGGVSHNTPRRQSEQQVADEVRALRLRLMPFASS